MTCGFPGLARWASNSTKTVNTQYIRRNGDEFRKLNPCYSDTKTCIYPIEKKCAKNHICNIVLNVEIEIALLVKETLLTFKNKMMIIMKFQVNLHLEILMPLYAKKNRPYKYN